MVPWRDDHLESDKRQYDRKTIGQFAEHMNEIGK